MIWEVATLKKRVSLQLRDIEARDGILHLEEVLNSCLDFLFTCKMSEVQRG